MKRILSMALSAGLILTTVLTGCSSATDATDNSSSEEKQVLKLFNWGEYIGENTVSAFEEQFNCKVICEYFDSNEMMYTKVQAGDCYDVLIPSDYMIERMISEDLLQPIDLSKVPNMEYLSDGVKNLAFDPTNEYSVPYLWGNVGLIYNKNNVPTELIEEQGYSILQNTDYVGKIYMYDSERDAFMLALKALGYSSNTENDAEINEAYEWLKQVNDTMDPVYVTDEVIDGMLNENKDIGVVYSGDAAYVISENENLSFTIPKEGSNLWCDCMVIPKNAENPDLAHEFINFALSYDAALDISETVGYTSANKDVMAAMSAEDGTYFENPAYIPRENYELDEVFVDNETLRQKLSELWIKVKAQ